MNDLLPALLANTCMATFLALLAYLVSRKTRFPAWTHALWLLVLVKLVTPPFVRVPLIENPVTWHEVETRVVEDAETYYLIDASETYGVDATPVLEASRAPSHDRATHLPWIPALLALWAIGTLLIACLSLHRALRFHALLAMARPAPRTIRDLARSLARVLELPDVPPIELVDARISPMLWGVPPARILLPKELVERLSRDSLATLLAHELAHYKRRDHWVRYLELAATTVLWWHPLVWLARRELREAEEQSCDAWVLKALPRRGKVYAMALLDTIDFVTAARVSLPPAASGAGHAHHLKRRVTMIMEGRTTSRLGLASRLTFAGLAMTFLPIVPIRGQEPDKEPAKPGTVAEVPRIISGVTFTPAPQDPEAAAKPKRSVPVLQDLPILRYLTDPTPPVTYIGSEPPGGGAFLELVGVEEPRKPVAAQDEDLRAAVRSLKEANEKLGEAIGHLERRLDARDGKAPRSIYWRSFDGDGKSYVIEYMKDGRRYRLLQEGDAKTPPKRETVRWRTAPQGDSQARQPIRWRVEEKKDAPEEQPYRFEIRAIDPGIYHVVPSKEGGVESFRVEAEGDVRVESKPGKDGEEVMIIRGGKVRFDAPVSVRRSKIRFADPPVESETKDLGGKVIERVDLTTPQVIVQPPPVEKHRVIQGKVLDTQGRVVKAYVVREGDTLHEIAARELGNGKRFTEIVDINGKLDPRTLKPGQVLILPADAKPKAKAKDKEPESKQETWLNTP